MNYAPAARAVRPASEKQRSFVQSLLGDIEPSADAAARRFAEIEADGTFESVRATSRLIDSLLADARAVRAAKRARPQGQAQDTMPEPGYYAVDYQDVLRFYRVAEGKGRWDGRRFLNRYRSDYQDRVGRAEREASVEAILADPDAAAMRFARETVRCFLCGRRLTDAVSRARGTGPDCAGLR
jgi:hypothetical protein